MMNLLLFLESELATLKKKLSLCFNQRIKTYLIFEFLEKLTSKPINLEPYLLEVLPLLESCLTNIEIKYISLDLIKNWLETIDEIKCKSQNPYLVEVSNFIQEGLTEKLSKQIKLIESKFNKTKEKKNNYASIFETILKSQSLVNIPFVEHEPLLADEQTIFGTVKKLKVIVTKISKNASADEVDIQMLSQKEKAHEYLKLIEASEKLFTEVTGIKLTDKLSFHCSVEQHNLISGNSLEAGFVTAIFIALYKLYDVKTSFDFPRTHAITGGLDEHGNLLPIDEDGLKRKIEACAFSEITTLLIPKSQEVFANNYLKELEEQHEGKKLLEIIGLSNIREVYFDRRNLNQSISTFSQRTIKSIWNKRRPIAAILFLIMAVVIGRTFLGPLDMHPAIIIYEEDDLVIKNWLYQELKRIEIGSRQVEYALTLYDPNDLIADTCDVDTDGYADVIYFDRLMKDSNYEKMICYSVVKDSVLWSYNLRKKINIPNNPVPGEYINGRFLKAGDYDQDKNPEVYVVASSNYSPGMIIKFDAQTGKELASYVHYGHLTKIRFSDLDDDGSKELITSGTNQAFGTSCLIVLDPKSIHGHGPVNELNKIEGYDEAKEKYYIKIPFTIVAKAYGAAASYSLANNITVKDENEDIRLEIRDSAYDAGYGNPEFYIHFDFNLQAVEFAKSDNYNTHAINLLKEKKISRFPDAAYFEEFKKEITYLKKPNKQ